MAYCRNLFFFRTVLHILRDILLPIHDYTYYIFLILGLAVVFSGPSRTADDVISRDVPWLQRLFNHMLKYLLSSLLPSALDCQLLLSSRLHGMERLQSLITTQRSIPREDSNRP